MKATVEQAPMQSWRAGLVALSGNLNDFGEPRDMCTDDMDGDTTNNYLRHHQKNHLPSMKMRWRRKRRPIRLRSLEDASSFRGSSTAEQQEEAAREKRWWSLRRCDAELTRSNTNTGAAAPCPGAMAPRNTTQYLMAANGYAGLLSSSLSPVETSSAASPDLYGESLSPASFSAALDCVCYDDSLAFQQRDFDDVLGRL